MRSCWDSSSCSVSSRSPRRANPHGCRSFLQRTNLHSCRSFLERRKLHGCRSFLERTKLHSCRSFLQRTKLHSCRSFLQRTKLHSCRSFLERTKLHSCRSFLQRTNLHSCRCLLRRLEGLLAAQSLQRRLGLERLAEIIALPIFAAHFLKSLRGGLGLDDFSDRREIQAAGHLHHRGHHPRVGLIRGHAVHEGAIDLHEVERKQLQIAQR